MENDPSPTRSSKRFRLFGDTSTSKDKIESNMAMEHENKAANVNSASTLDPSGYNAVLPTSTIKAGSIEYMTSQPNISLSLHSINQRHQETFRSLGTTNAVEATENSKMLSEPVRKESNNLFSVILGNEAYNENLHNKTTTTERKTTMNPNSVTRLISESKMSPHGASKNQTRYGTYIQNINDTCMRVVCDYNHTHPDIWAREVVVVKVIPEDKVKYFHRKSKSFDRIGKRKEMGVHLTPAIITVWAYELGFALSTGSQHLITTSF